MSIFLPVEDMVDSAPDQGGFREGFGSLGGARRGPRGRGCGDKSDKEWVPVTKLDCLVNARKIKSLDCIFIASLPMKKHKILDHILRKILKHEILKVM